MSPYSQLLQPPAEYIAGLESGKYVINQGANRVVDAGTKRMVAALVPGGGLQDELAKLPLDPAGASKALEAVPALKNMAPMLQAMQLTATVGALASVANLGVSCVGFAIVIKKLSRIEGKLDNALEKLEVLQHSVKELHLRLEALSLARVRSAEEALERALEAETERRRLELARGARELFSESKNLYLELWKHARPWERLTVDIPTAIELKNRFVASAIGEIQAEFICGDMGSFRHAVKKACANYAEYFVVDPPEAFRARSDEACGDLKQLSQLAGHLPELSAQLQLASAVTGYTEKKLRSFELDADLPEQLGLASHDVARAVREADGCLVYAIAL